MRTTLEQPIPAHGSQDFFFNQQEAKAPFKLKTLSDGSYYFVKIEKWDTGEVIATYFVSSARL